MSYRDEVKKELDAAEMGLKKLPEDHPTLVALRRLQDANEAFERSIHEENPDPAVASGEKLMEASAAYGQSLAALVGTNWEAMVAGFPN